MAKEFNCLPRAILGLTDTDDLLLAIQVDRAVMTFGTFVQARIEEQVEKPVSQQKKRQTELVQKYKPKEIRDMIYGKLISREEAAATIAVRTAVRSGQVNPYEIEDELDEGSIPPSMRGDTAQRPVSG